MSASGTYVYCILAARKPPEVSRRVCGPPGTGRPRMLPIKSGRYLAVSDAPLDQYGEQRVGALLSDLRWVSRAAVAHEAVITSLLRRSEAVVPMQLFTIFASDDRALGQVKSDWTRIERVLRRVMHRVEWGVRLSFDERRRTKSFEEGPAETGLDYLRAKHRMRIAAVHQAQNHRRRVTAALRTLSAAATDTKRRAIAARSDDGRRLLLDAAFLVPRQQSARFRAAVKRQARAMARSGYLVQLTGPWPPYSFVEHRK